MITPEKIRARSVAVYHEYLRAWIAGDADDFFPHRLRANLTPSKGDLPKAKGELDRLRNASKSSRGWGYRVDWKRRRSREYGLNNFPQAIWIDSRADLLLLCDATDHFQQTEQVVTALQSRLPGLAGWMRRNGIRIASLAPKITDLITVAEYFVAHPWPQCFVRELRLNVDTKFIQRNHKLLRQWLDLLLTDSQMDVNEAKFARRFGLRDDIQHHTLHLLDDSLRAELGLPFKELSLTGADLASLPVKDCNLFIVENRTNLLTLPAVRRGLAIGGEGNAVTRYGRFPWLNECMLYYWGDLDSAGLQILSNVRTQLGMQVTSLMMDLKTLDELAHKIASRPTVPRGVPSNLHASELAAFQRCCEKQIWIEQERIPQSYVREIFSSLVGDAHE